jgi:hypothetical protein
LPVSRRAKMALEGAVDSEETKTMDLLIICDKINLSIKREAKDICLQAIDCSGYSLNCPYFRRLNHLDKER